MLDIRPTAAILYLIQYVYLYNCHKFIVKYAKRLVLTKSTSKMITVTKDY